MLLAIETAHAACSVAVIDAGRVVAHRHEIVGRGHAERIAPMIAEVLAEAGTRPTAVTVDVGPGSFTGIRVGVAAARALGLVWRVPVTGFSSTALVAVTAFARDASLAEVTATMDGGRGELFVEPFRRLGSLAPAEALTPNEAAAAMRAAGRCVVAGTGVAALIAAEPGLRSIGEAPPDAADVRLLPEDMRRLQPSPLYVRAPDAKLPQGAAAAS